ncbi:MAG: leucine--tRNA ligase [Candidatus Bathyarchaeota archaeon]|nr:leucine--tRNA ligase [Candidatus Bathyarchaeota archaeon]
MSHIKQIEEKWQKKWEKAKIFEANPDAKKKKIFVTFPYPYMNGPLHVGHTFTASRVDVYARFKRMQGYNVLWPWSWHWTGQPLLGASQRVAKGDKEFIRVLRDVDGVPENELKKFVDPLYMAQYYTNEGKIAAKRIGFSIDWRREFTTIMPTYQKFIKWQYKKLKKEGYVSKGTHPVVWCPKDNSPTGDHDRQVGEGVTPEEYTLIKYRLDDKRFLPAATFRPETIYGVTNIWLNPDANYVEALVNKEIWIISKQAAVKLKEQEKKAKIHRVFKGEELIGKKFENPISGKKYLILPGWFVDSNQGTGVVYSVPAHAPYDWLALRDLKEKPKVIKKYDLDIEEIKKIKPISIIKVEGENDFPAVDLVNNMGIKDQNDPRAEEATKILYKKEFHSGILKENCGPYAGKTVSEVKELLIKDFKKSGIADSMYDLPQSVVCRCMTSCIVKILSDQWFLNYSDIEWKKKAKEAIANMNIYPESARQWFIGVIDWLREWACARTTGFGTPLPWGKGWIIETLSDSTVYMAFYTINNHIVKNKIDPQSLIPEIFDYIFYGKGTLSDLTKQSQIPINILKKMREEFLYWYPFDLRVSAKELVPNHLSFCIFHHTALFPPNQWPKGIGVNGMLMIEGKQMHKSKGNFVTMKNAVDSYGADATRCALLIGAEAMDDPDWRNENAKDLKEKFKALKGFASKVIAAPKEKQIGHLEKWLISKLHQRIIQVTESIENLKTRTALEVALYEIWNDFRWYINRKQKTNTATLTSALEIWIKLLTPFAPYICEELWSTLGNKNFISIAKWPQKNDLKVDLEAEEKENILVDLVEDTLNILKATKISPKQIYYYSAADWKRKIYQSILEKAVKGQVNFKDIMQEFAQDPGLRKKMKSVASYVPKTLKILNKYPAERKKRLIEATILDEKDFIDSASKFLEKRFNTKVSVYAEEDKTRYDPKNRSGLAIPGQPAIFIE